MVPTYFGIYELDESSTLASPASTRPYFTEGFVHTVKDRDAILITRNKSDIKIPITMMASHDLRMGDWIEVKAAYHTGSSRSIATEIIKINGDSSCIRANAPIKNFLDQPADEPTREIVLSGQKIKLGSRVAVTLECESDKIRHMKNAISNDENVVKIAILINEGDYVVNALTRAGFSNVFLTIPDESIRRQASAILFALFWAQFETAKGKDVVLFVDGLNKISRIYDKTRHDKDGMLDISKVFVGAIEDAKILFRSAKQIQDGGSLTIITYMGPPNNPAEEYMRADFLSMANQVINLTSSALDSTL